MAAIARHRWIDHLRKQSRNIEIELFDTIASEDVSDTSDYFKDLETMMQVIPPQQAQVIRLVKIEGQTIEEASQNTGHSTASIKVMIHRGMKRMIEAARKEAS
jgi:RNA polymerase sigma-70 factor (ECF subfamily)